MIPPRALTSFEDIFDQWPNLAEFARDMEVPYQRVYRWQARAQIPLPYWPKLQVLLRDRGLPMSFEQLSRCLPQPVIAMATSQEEGAASPPSDS